MKTHIVLTYIDLGDTKEVEVTEESSIILNTRPKISTSTTLRSSTLRVDDNIIASVDEITISVSEVNVEPENSSPIAITSSCVESPEVDEIIA